LAERFSGEEILWRAVDVLHIFMTIVSGYQVLFAEKFEKAAYGVGPQLPVYVIVVNHFQFK
jgi:hypothetical protein